MTRFDVEIVCCRCKWAMWWRGITNMEKPQAWYEDHLDEVHPVPVDEGADVQVIIAR